MTPTAANAHFDRLAAAARAGDELEFRRLLESAGFATRFYLGSFLLDGAPPGLTDRYVGDATQRFLHTLDFVPLPPPARILELGANPYFFHILLRRLFPDSTVEGANFFDHDIFSTAIGEATHHLRSVEFGEDWTFTYPLFNLEGVPAYPLPPASFDLVFLCETLEHLVVDPLAIFRKIRRLVAPGGHLIITLPNALRIANLACMLDGYNFFDLYHPYTGVHGRHNREYTLDEMKRLLRLNGLEVCRAETRDRADYDHTPFEAVDYSRDELVFIHRRRAQLYELLRAAGGKLEDRGDNLYLLARRPLAVFGPGHPVPSPGGLAPSARPARPSPRVRAFVDRLEDTAGKLEVEGWACLSDELGDPDDWVRLVLQSAEHCFSLGCERRHRPDVAAAQGLDRDDPGFHAAVDKALLPRGRYRVGVLLGGPGLEEGFAELGFETAVG